MCAVSMVGDYFSETIPRKYPFVVPDGSQQYQFYPVYPVPSKEEFDALKKDVADMKNLLLRAKAYDEETGQKDCEKAEKVAMLRDIAKAVGIDLDEVFGHNNEL